MVRERCTSVHRAGSLHRGRFPPPQFARNLPPLAGSERSPEWAHISRERTGRTTTSVNRGACGPGPAALAWRTHRMDNRRASSGLIVGRSYTTQALARRLRQRTTSPS